MAIPSRSEAYEKCPCTTRWTPAIGTYDTVTGEWLPDKPTVHVRLIPDVACPRHPSIGCFACSERSVRLRPFGIDQGWAVRADEMYAEHPRYAACPAHVDIMPPHPEGLNVVDNDS